jgi:hypothetical protein
MGYSVLQFRIEADLDSEFKVVRVLIDGRDLIDRVRELEVPLARAEDNPHLAGAYSGMSCEEWRARSRPDADGRRPVLACECGVVDCWPLVARVVAGDKTVTWSDFKQPFRPRWSYMSLGPFVFDRGQYQAELEKIGCALTSNPA